MPANPATSVPFYPFIAKGSTATAFETPSLDWHKTAEDINLNGLENYLVKATSGEG